MNNSELSINELTSAGRELLKSRDGIDAHRAFVLWVDDVADWLDHHVTNSGQSAIWSGLATSTLVTGTKYFDNPRAWDGFHSAVRERLSWLGTLQLRGEQTESDGPDFSKTNDIFVVHGHDNELKQEVARTLSQLELNPIILHERPNRGQTIIEKFERESNVGFAVILLSSDDFAYAHNKGTETGKSRARQNVVLELGYFVGKLGRSRVCALKKGDIEVPSDFAGVVYTPCDNSVEWRFKLAQELSAAGYKIDLNKLISK